MMCCRRYGLRGSLEYCEKQYCSVACWHQQGRILCWGAPDRRRANWNSLWQGTEVLALPRCTTLALVESNTAWEGRWEPGTTLLQVSGMTAKFCSQCHPQEKFPHWEGIFCSTGKYIWLIGLISLCFSKWSTLPTVNDSIHQQGNSHCFSSAATAIRSWCPGLKSVKHLSRKSCVRL